MRGTTAHVSRCSLVVNVSKKIMRRLTIFLLWMLLIVNGANFGITTAQGKLYLITSLLEIATRFSNQPMMSGTRTYLFGASKFGNFGCVREKS